MADQAPETPTPASIAFAAIGLEAERLRTENERLESDLRASRAHAADLQGEIAQLTALVDAERTRLILHNNEEQDRRREAERQVSILRDRADRAEEGLRISKLRNDELHVEGREIVGQRTAAETECILLADQVETLTEVVKQYAGEIGTAVGENDRLQLLVEHRGELLERSKARLTGLVYAWASLHDEHCGRPEGFCDALQRIQRLSGVAGEEPPSADAAAPAPSTPTTAQGWQDISTAPKDGSMFLAANTDQGGLRMLVWWSPVYSYFCGPGGAGHVQFTHWQPLPAPPSEGGPRS